MTGALVDLALFLAAAVLSLFGCVTLALSQERHWRAVGSGTSPPRPPQTLAWLGWCLTGASLVLSILRDGPSFAALVWPLLIAASALSVGLILAYVPHWLKPVAATFARTGSKAPPGG